MTTPKTKASDYLSDIAEVPAEEPLARMLLNRFTAWNNSMPEELTFTDNAALDELLTHAATYAGAAREAWARNSASWHRPLTWGNTTAPDSVQALIDTVAKYVQRCRSNELIPLDNGESIAVPALARLRAVFKSDGAKVAAQIEAAIAEGRARVANARANERARRAAAKFWITVPQIRVLLEGIVEHVATRRATINAPGGLVDLRRESQAYINDAGRNGSPVEHAQLFAHEWRGWLRFVQDALAEEAQQMAAA